MALTDTQACNNCSNTGVDLWVISGECEHRNCTKCVADNVEKCKTCRRAKVIECLHGSSGCSGVFKRQFEDQLEHHLKTCHYLKVPCPLDCPENLNKRDLVYHVSDLCPKRLVPCSHCEGNFFGEEIKRHLATCGYVPVKCEFCEDETLRMDMNAHLKECPFAVWPCEFSTLGCDFKGTSQDLQEHLTLSIHAKLITARERDSEEKMKVLCEQVKRLLQEVELLKDDGKTSQERLQACEEKQRYLEEENKALKEEIKYLNKELNGSIIDQKRVPELNEAFRSKREDDVEELTSLLRRLDAIEENKERERQKLLSFSDSLRAELLPGLETKKASKDGLDVVLSCFEVVKDWAADMKHLQKIIMSREDIFFINYLHDNSAAEEIKRNSQINFNAVFNLGLEELALISHTYVLDRSGNVTAKEINSPYESVALVVRFRFLIRRDTTDVFAEVSHSTVSEVGVELIKYPKQNLILQTTLTGLQKRVNKVPIFCGCIQTPELSFDWDSFCFFMFVS